MSAPINVIATADAILEAFRSAPWKLKVFDQATVIGGMLVIGLQDLLDPNHTLCFHARPDIHDLFDKKATLPPRPAVELDDKLEVLQKSEFEAMNDLLKTRTLIVHPEQDKQQLVKSVTREVKRPKDLDGFSLTFVVRVRAWTGTIDGEYPLDEIFPRTTLDKIYAAADTPQQSGYQFRSLFP